MVTGPASVGENTSTRRTRWRREWVWPTLLGPRTRATIGPMREESPFAHSTLAPTTEVHLVTPGTDLPCLRGGTINF